MDVEKRNLVDNEILRLKVQHHPNFQPWYGSLPPHAREVFDILIENDATPELIELAKQSPDEEWGNFDFLHILGNGNPKPSVARALTNAALYDILYTLDDPDEIEN